MSDSMYIGPDRFPKLIIKRGCSRRLLYFDQLEAKQQESLKKRGYEPVLIATLPRSNPQEERAYLKAKAQGIEEGTIEIDKESVAILRMMFQHARLLDDHKLGDDEQFVDSSLTTEEQVETLLNWSGTRHTTDQSTIDLVEQEKGKK